MVAASRNCAAETPPMRRSDPAVGSTFSAYDQIRKPLFLVKPIVAQSVPCASIQRPGAGWLARSQGARDTEWMSIAEGLAALFSRDLTRLIQELQAFPERRDAVAAIAPASRIRPEIWCCTWKAICASTSGVSWAASAYTRARDREFTLTGVSRDESGAADGAGEGTGSEGCVATIR